MAHGCLRTLTGGRVQSVFESEYISKTTKYKLLDYKRIVIIFIGGIAFSMTNVLAKNLALENISFVICAATIFVIIFLEFNRYFNLLKRGRDEVGRGSED